MNPNLLIHSFDYYEFENEDAWGDVTYKAPVHIDHVRIDENIIFVYADHWAPTLEFKRRSKVVTKDGTFLINNVVKISAPFEDKTWSVELELV